MPIYWNYNYKSQWIIDNRGFFSLRCYWSTLDLFNNFLLAKDNAIAPCLRRLCTAESKRRPTIIKVEKKKKKNERPPDSETCFKRSAVRLKAYHDSLSSERNWSSLQLVWSGIFTAVILTQMLMIAIKAGLVNDIWRGAVGAGWGGVGGGWVCCECAVTDLGVSMWVWYGNWINAAYLNPQRDKLNKAPLKIHACRQRSRARLIASDCAGSTRQRLQLQNKETSQVFETRYLSRLLH